MIAKSKDVYIDMLEDIDDKYHNLYYGKIKTKPTDVKSSTYINFEVENNVEDKNLKLVII